MKIHFIWYTKLNKNILENISQQERKNSRQNFETGFRAHFSKGTFFFRNHFPIRISDPHFPNSEIPIFLSVRPLRVL